MSRKFILSIIIFLDSFPAGACDVCGCSSGGSYMGILPQFHKHFIGIHYSLREFNSVHSSIANEDNSSSREIFNTIELRGRYILSKRIQLLARIPFHVNFQTEGGMASSHSGFGDPVIISNYTLINTGDSTNHRWKHTLQAGAGLQLPLGSFNETDHTGSLNPNVQAGTGAWSLLADVVYTVRYQKTGLNATALYQVNTLNPNGYLFGNRMSTALSLFYWMNIRGFSLLPHTGLLYEDVAPDRHRSVLLESSGSHSVFSITGVEFYYHRFTLGASCHFPVYEENKLIHHKVTYTIQALFNF